MRRPSGYILILAFFVCAGIFLYAPSIQAGIVNPRLQSALETLNAEDDIHVIISFSGKVNPGVFKGRDKRSRRSQLVEALKGKAEESQKPVRAFLGDRKDVKRVRSLWIINALAATIPAKMVPQVAALPGVESIEPDVIISAPQVSPSFAGVTEWNIEMVRAPEVWSLGYTGQGVVVASVDTGADVYHQDLAGRWRGGTNSWFDANDPDFDPFNSTPYDLDGHGTSVMGILVGGDAGGSAIGVAPGAQWIAAKIFDDQGQALESEIHAALQWLLDPDGYPETDDAPHVVVNSWGFTQQTDQCLYTAGEISFRTDIQVLRAAGIAMVFAAGNNGPSAYTSTSPANYPEAFAVGAVDETLSISDFSARGPSACDGGIYPDVVAPGDSNSFPYGIKTADLTFGIFPDSYTYLTGTSMAAPHAAGAMALLLNAFPELSVESLESVLKDSASDLGEQGPDNETGYGLIDCFEAYRLLADVVTVTRASVNRAGHFVVWATSSAQPEAVLMAEGLGRLRWNPAKERYQRAFKVPIPGSVTVTSSLGGSASVPVPCPPPPVADTVTITRAFANRAGNFVVWATSSAQPGAVLTVQGLGRLRWNATAARYQRAFAVPVPGSVTVTSSLGGLDTQNVPFP